MQIFEEKTCQQLHLSQTNMAVDSNKIKRCKDCDPNKYIEGVAYRGANGHNFDDSSSIYFGSDSKGFALIQNYNAVGEPKDRTNLNDPNVNPNATAASSSSALDQGINVNADLSDLIEDFNPILNKRTLASQIIDGTYRGSVEGIDPSTGFWFIWDLRDGLVFSGGAKITATPAKINSNGYITTQKGSNFQYTITTETATVSYFYLSKTSGFDQLTLQGNSTNPNDKINTGKVISTSKITKVGYYTIQLNAAVMTNKVDKKKRAVTADSFKTLTIKSKDSLGNDPIKIISNPIIRATVGTVIDYTVTVPNGWIGDWDATIGDEGLKILDQLGLTWDQTNKRIYGTAPNRYPYIGSPQIIPLSINVKNIDSASGQAKTFVLNFVLGSSSGTAPIINLVDNTSLPTGQVNKPFKYAIPASKGVIYFAATDLPKGLKLDNGTGLITGIPQDGLENFEVKIQVANTYVGSASNSIKTIKFNINPDETPKITPLVSYPSKIDLYSNYGFDTQNAKVSITVSKNYNSDDKIRFERITEDIPVATVNDFALTKAGSSTPIVDSKTIEFENITGPKGNNRRFLIYADDPTYITADLEIVQEIQYEPAGYGSMGSNSNGVKYVPKKNQYGTIITKPKIDPITKKPVYTLTKATKTKNQNKEIAISFPVVMDIKAGVNYEIDAGGKICYNPSTNTDEANKGPASKASIKDLNLAVRETTRLYNYSPPQAKYILNPKKGKKNEIDYPGAYYCNLPTETQKLISIKEADFLIPDLYWNTDEIKAETDINNKKLKTRDSDAQPENSPGQIEYQAYYSALSSYNGKSLPSKLQGGEVKLETTLNLTPKILKNSLLKYPLGIPAAPGVYGCRIVPAGTCTFFHPQSPFKNSSEPTFILILYAKADDILKNNTAYLCTYTTRTTVNDKNKDETKTVIDLVGDKTGYTASTISNFLKFGSCKATKGIVPDFYHFKNYAQQYYNDPFASQDVGITSLTNISLLDIISEGPIEGIVDYEIRPRTDNKEGMIGYEKGVYIEKYSQNENQNALIRSIYWNETPIADNSYPGNGSLNFDFVKLSYTNGDKPSLHTNLQLHKYLDIKEEFYTKKLAPGTNVTDLLNVKKSDVGVIKDSNLTDQNLIVKIPRYISSTKVSGIKLPGARKIQTTGEIKQYKKSINILTKDLYGLRIHIKANSLFRQIVDLSIFESSAQSAENTTSGRVDRYVQLYYLRLKRIDYSPIEGQTSSYVLKDGTVIDSRSLNANTYNVNRDAWILKIVGKLNQGSYIETFEWLGLNKVSTKDTIGWEIEVTPIHYESTDINIINKSNIDSITEIYNDKLTNPNTATVLTTFDARYFGSIPQRAYDTRLLKVKIPINYNPYSRTYQGTWNGEFALGWTDNPAWCFYDMITNNRFGLGKYFDSKYIDKWSLYEIGRYCDQLVKSKRSITDQDVTPYFDLEPRFTCNLLLSTREDAYKVLNDMASIFRGIVYYTAGLIFASQDRPKEAVYLFNNSNVKEGEFIYSNTSKRVRRNVILIRYNDKNNFYKPAIKYVENREGILRYGIKEMEMSAFGCTSESQAERYGKWMLLSENSEAELVSFETSLPALYLKPGDVVLIQDQNRQNKIFGGRTYQLEEDFAILDLKYNDITGFLPAIGNCKFNVLTPAGNIEMGTPNANLLIDELNADTYSNNTADFSKTKNILDQLEGIDTDQLKNINSNVIRKKQVQTIDYSAGFLPYILEETGVNYNGYTKIRFPDGFRLDNTQHTLLQNTVWTIEIDPETYKSDLSPSVKSDINNNQYVGKNLEPYIDQTQKFRVLDIEEVEENKYKISALQYDEKKFMEADRI